MSGDDLFVRDRLYIGGEWVLPHSGRVIQSIDPATETVWAHVAEADETDIDVAVKAARAALSGPWSRMDPTKRGAILYKLAQLITANARQLAEIESRDNGKPVRDTLGEMQRAADWLTFFAGAADKVNGAQIPFKTASRSASSGPSCRGTRRSSCAAGSSARRSPPATPW